jgi:hypothetical protein
MPGLVQGIRILAADSFFEGADGWDIGEQSDAVL